MVHIFKDACVEHYDSILKEYGNSYSTRNIEFMAQFANEFSLGEIVEQPARLIPWYTLIRIIKFI